MLTDGGDAPAPGWVFIQPDLAASLRLIAAEGVRAFYRGALAEKFANFYESRGGLLRRSDLSSYQAEQAEPIVTDFRGLQVYQSAPNSQGIVMLLALNLLEGYDLASQGHNSAEAVHLIAESLKLAFADRNQYIADPRFARDMPIGELLSKEYAEVRRGLIRRDRAIAGAAPPGDPRRGEAVLKGREIAYETGAPRIQRAEEPDEGGGETSSFSIADQFGNLVSVTHSVNAGFGSGMVVPGTGIVLNDRMPYFSLDEDDINVLEPGKRTRHTVQPGAGAQERKALSGLEHPGRRQPAPGDAASVSERRRLRHERTAGG